MPEELQPVNLNIICYLGSDGEGGIRQNCLALRPGHLHLGRLSVSKQANAVIVILAANTGMIPGAHGQVIQASVWQREA